MTTISFSLQRTIGCQNTLGDRINNDDDNDNNNSHDNEIVVLNEDKSDLG